MTGFDASAYRNALHICFTQSGGGILRQALRLFGLEPKVIATSDDLSLGPINPPDSKLRIAWLQREFEQCDYADGWGWTAWDYDEFWPVTLAKWEKRFIWFSRRSSMEFCGFLEWVRRAGASDYAVVDVSEAMVQSRTTDGQTHEHLMESIAMVHPDVVRLDQLLGSARALTSEENTQYLKLWTQLQNDNAAFRIVDRSGIRSAPLDYFDSLILSRVVADWQKSARVVGSAMADAFKDGYHNGGDLAVFGRLRALAAKGDVEARGDLSQMRSSEVRLKQA